MKHDGIVRNRLKIKSAIGNARALLAVAAEHGSFRRLDLAVHRRADRSPARAAAAPTCPRARR
jgi:3-methyladenine DNA glycosylase Tag